MGLVGFDRGNRKGELEAMKKPPYDLSKHNLHKSIANDGVYVTAEIRELEKTVLKLRMDNAILQMELDNLNDRADEVCEYGPYDFLLNGRKPQCEPSLTVVQRGPLPYTYCPHCGRQIFLSGNTLNIDDYDIPF